MRGPDERHEEVPWTAARCNRLLRTITSRLGILRKLAKHTTQAETTGRWNSEPIAPIVPPPAEGLSHVPADPLPATSPRARDPDWLPQNRKRQCDRTYVGNCKRRKVKTDCEEGRTAHDFRTPFIKRVLVSTSTPSGVESPTPTLLGKCNIANPNERKRRGLPILPTSSADQACRSLLDAFEALLVATKPITAPSRLGTSSLANTCLRKIPAYIDLEQSYTGNGNGAESRDITADTYEFLESFGSRIGGGWHGLQFFVRAHAVCLIQGAVKDGILPGDPLDALLAVCSRSRATEEVQSILTAWLESQVVLTKAKLEKFTSRCVALGHRSLLLRCYKDLIQRDPVALQKLTELPAVWCEVVKAFVSTSTRAIASSFCEAYIGACMNQDRITDSPYEKPKEGKIHEANILLTAFAWKQGGTDSTNDTAQYFSRWCHYACLAAYSANRIDFLIEQFLLSSLALQIVGFQSSQNINCLAGEALIDLFYEHLGSGTVSIIVDFFCNVGKNVSYVDHDSACRFMKSATSGFLQMAKRCNRDLAAVSRQIASSTAKVWTDHRDDNESYSLLEEVEYAIWESELHQAASSPVRSQRPISYRWEEGLSEWVAKTPNIRDFTAFLPTDSSLDDMHDSGVDLDCDSPDEKRNSRESVSTMAVLLGIDDWDDEDELALITPVQQRQKGARVRFDLRQEAGGCTKMSKLLRPNTIPLADDVSDDELA